MKLIFSLIFVFLVGCSQHDQGDVKQITELKAQNASLQSQLDVIKSELDAIKSEQQSRYFTINSESGDTWVVDRESRGRENDGKTIWVSENDSDGTTNMQYLFDCDRRLSKAIIFITKDKSGKVLYSSPVLQGYARARAPWTLIEPNTVIEMVMREACR